MDAYVLGNLLGRLLMSGLIVFLLLFCFSRFDLKRALRRMKGLVPILAVILLFVLGLAAHALRR